MAPRAYYAICGVGVDGKHEAVQDCIGSAREEDIDGRPTY